MSLASLIAEVEKLTAPSREVDARVVAFLNRAMVKPYPPTDDFGPRDRWQFWTLDGAHFLGSEGRFPVPPLSASIDAVVALIERELPGEAPTIMLDAIRAWIVSGADLKALARFMLAAFLRAIEARAG